LRIREVGTVPSYEHVVAAIMATGLLQYCTMECHTDRHCCHVLGSEVRKKSTVFVEYSIVLAIEFEAPSFRPPLIS